MTPPSGPGPGTVPAADGQRTGPAPRRPPPPLRLSGSEDMPALRGWLHLAAFVATLPVGVALVWHADGRADIVLFCVALATLYGVSSAYHLLPMGADARAWMRRIDHSTIYLYMASAFTPYALLADPGTLGRAMLGVMWAGAALGVAAKLCRFERSRMLSGALYLVLGWAPVVTLPVALSHLDGVQIALFFTMGGLYTLGSAVLAFRRPDPFPWVFGYHEVWHTMVVVATCCYCVVLWSLTG